MAVNKLSQKKKKEMKKKNHQWGKNILNSIPTMYIDTR
jgi:hypothetical protein